MILLRSDQIESFAKMNGLLLQSTIFLLELFHLQLHAIVLALQTTKFLAVLTSL